jgi:hypothetical protein
MVLTRVPFDADTAAGRFAQSPPFSSSTTTSSSTRLGDSALPLPVHDACHACLLPRGSLCPPLHPGSLCLVRAHGHRRTIRQPRTRPRRCISYAPASLPATTPTPLRPPPSSSAKALIRCPVTGNPFRESGPPACMAKLIMMRHKVRSPRSFLLRPFAPCYCIMIVLTPIARLSVEPDQYPTAAHNSGSPTQRTAPVHTPHTTPTTCAVDPRFQTFQSATSLTVIASFPSRPVCFQHANDPDNVPIDHFNARAPPPLRPPSRLRIFIYTPKIYLPLPY